MQIRFKNIALFSALVISTLSSCKKNTDSKNINNEGENAKSDEESNSDDESFANESKDKFCTDLLDDANNPLGKYQWHLYNTGKTAFTTDYPKAGEDINVYSVLKDQCLSGKGIYVGVVDSGLEIKHPSLSPNIDNIINKSKTWSINFRNNGFAKNDPSPTHDDDRDHGTMVSGIIAMRSNLGFGGSGVAPRAQLSGYNTITREGQTFQNFMDSLGASDASKGNDIFSMSFGSNNLRQLKEDEPSIKASIESFKFGTKSLRNGKGAIYVKAAGNGYNSLGLGSELSCESANKFKLSCQNSNMNFESTMAEVITVAALNAQGKKSSYSTTGSSLWISAPGGEFGKNKAWIEEKLKNINETIDWSKYKPTLGEPAIFTTDVSGKEYGASKVIDYKKKDPILQIGNSFNACDIIENKDGNYTNSMNGTSSATPVTSGSIALILEANPDLTWRDVKYILAKTATQVDKEFNGVNIQLENGNNYQAELGWITNKAGFHFSNWYGFGRINVAEAVNLAKNYNNSLGKYVENDWVKPIGSNFNELINPGDLKGFTSEIEVNKEDSLKIESLQVRVSVSSKYIGDISIELVSPSGTKNIIWNAANAFSKNGNMTDMQLQSNAFYGEESVGKWKLRIINTGIHKLDAIFKGWKLKVSGH
ncbi:S8 family serine peptidase [Pigmentibacter ruber]|uniref:S8 family serine peptidase n=1 Tax=Pigmentibacter ruber TaxID=2683196 RepID=UPI00131B41D9|nr:S8 family serine peptidase [Pigmentibacter ruber]